jgi:TatD DNase family protein
MNIIDTHSHVYLPDFDNDLEEMIKRCHVAGVTKVLLPNIDIDSIAKVKKLSAKDNTMFFPMMGLHPCSVKEDADDVLQKIKTELDSDNYYGVGEIGLDYYWDVTFKEKQIDAFKLQLQWAKEKKLPVSIHTRNALDDCIKYVAEMNDENLHGVFHCFGGTVEQAKQITDLGFYLGIGGVVTYKNGGLDKVLPEIGINNLVLETDAPYLTPVPFRGKRNEPAYLVHVAERISELCNTTTKEVCEVTTKNAMAVFAI